MTTALRAPFPYFGGKRSVAHEIWARLGAVRNFVDPFVGSAAVLLARPLPFDGVESVGDIDGHLVNVWRSLKHSAEKVAWHLMDPPNSIDMQTRRAALRLDLVQDLLSDPEWHHPRMAAYWIYNQSCFTVADTKDTGPCTPRMWRNGMGVCAYRDDDKLVAELMALKDRLRHVVICYGDWKRLTTFAALQSHGLSGIFLDPPYGVEDRHEVYAHDSRDIAKEVFEWAISNQDDPLLRIAVCGYEGEHEFPPTWEVLRWVAHGFVGKRGSQGRTNRTRERIWYSPNCIPPQQTQLKLFE